MMARSPGPPETEADFALAVAEQAPARPRRCALGACGRRATQVVIEVSGSVLSGEERASPSPSLPAAGRYMLAKEPCWTNSLQCGRQLERGG